MGSARTAIVIATVWDFIGPPAMAQCYAPRRLFISNAPDLAFSGLMSPELLLHKFGYIAVFIGTFLEGETILVMAGFFAQRGYLQLVGVILVAAAGAYVGHVFWFWLGRTKGVQLLERFPKMKKHFGKGIRIFERYGAPAIFITQWLYGLRVTCAVIIGISRISVVKFLVYEAITCIVNEKLDH